MWKDATPKQSEKKLLSAGNIGTTMDVSAGSTFKACRWSPIKFECAPTIQYPQDTLQYSPKLYTPKRLKQSNDTEDTLKT
eukprot:11791373-Ditylum_brightwellii.AAC.1